jgi:hypothetical protein
VISVSTKQIHVYYLDELRVSNGSNGDLGTFAVARMGTRSRLKASAVHTSALRMRMHMQLCNNAQPRDEDGFYSNT